MNLLFQKLKHGEVSGQIVVIMVLLLAVLVVFIAVIINLGQIAQAKTVVSIAADMGVLTMASGASSFANSLWHTALDEESDDEVCKLSGIFGDIISVILDIVGILLAPVTGGLSLALTIAGLALQGYALSQNAANRAEIQARFNKMALEQTEQQRFAALAMQSALAMAVTDPVMVTDTHDLDMDGVVSDKVGRYDTLYEQKLFDDLSRTPSPYTGLRFWSVTYSWQDNLGWHHVYVSVEAPWGFPYLLNYDPNIFESCVTLAPQSYCGQKGSGAGKVTVIRYDQDRDWLNFASGKRLWRFLFAYPGTASVAPAPPMPQCQYKTRDDQAGLNCFGDNPLVNSPLTRGVKSEACAQWGYRAGYLSLLECTDANGSVYNYEAQKRQAGGHMTRPPCR